MGTVNMLLGKDIKKLAELFKQEDENSSEDDLPDAGLSKLGIHSISIFFIIF